MYLASSSCILPSAPIFNCGTILPSSSTSPISIDWSNELGYLIGLASFH